MIRKMRLVRLPKKNPRRGVVAKVDPRIPRNDVPHTKEAIRDHAPGGEKRQVVIIRNVERMPYVPSKGTRKWLRKREEELERERAEQKRRMLRVARKGDFFWEIYSTNGKPAVVMGRAAPRGIWSYIGLSPGKTAQEAIDRAPLIYPRLKKRKAELEIPEPKTPDASPLWRRVNDVREKFAKKKKWQLSNPKLNAIPAVAKAQAQLDKVLAEISRIRTQYQYDVAMRAYREQKRKMFSSYLIAEDVAPIGQWNGTRLVPFKSVPRKKPGRRSL